jgi:RNA polymerase sigma-70 factor (ECF subfamily)
MINSDNVELKNLLILLKKGDINAFNKLYNLHVKVLYKRVLNLVKDESTCEELIQDLFLKVWQGREGINIDLSFKSFLFTIAQNLVYDFFRKAAHNKRFIEHITHNTTHYYTHIEESLDAKETEEIINKAIEKLPPQRKLVYNLCKKEGRSYQDVSHILNISTATVNSHIVKSNNFIKEFLKANIEIAMVCIIMGAL